ncbi:MAG: GH92 family glycosyl hydrolase [Mycobacteriales bacterium]
MPRIPALLAAATVAGLLVGLPPAASAADLVDDPAALVNPLIGTTGAVNSFPGPDVPFGMVQWSPDTSPDRAYGGGYDYKDHLISGYSLTHLSGPGCHAYGDVPFLPTTAPLAGNPSSLTAAFAHTDEHAEAGYYDLTAGGVRTRLTATARSGMAEFAFPADQPANLLLKLSGSATGTSATSVSIGGDTVTGAVSSGHFCGAAATYTVYFSVTFDQPFTAHGTWSGTTIRPGDDGSAAANPNGAYLSFAPGQVVHAKAGISFVSTANATANRAADNPGWDFDTVHTAAHAAWNRVLSRVRIGGGDPTSQQIFYTALYHVFLHPNLFSDADGEYAGFDGATHRTAPGHPQYANYSGWDIYRTQIPLLAWLAPHETSDIVRSMLNEYDQSGALPKWTLANGETYVMTGDPAAPIIAGAYAFGARAFDTRKALDALVTQATTDTVMRPGRAVEDAYGYLPVDETYGCCHFYGPVSTQLEYDVADFAVSRLAGALGDHRHASQLEARSQNWTAIFNPGSGFMQPKTRTGAWLPGFNPVATTNFVEGNSYQYTPMVPHNLRGLIDASGGNASWVSYLDGVLTQLHGARAVPYVDMGNEPSFEVPWEYDYAGAPWKAQQAVRRVQQELYTATPAGEAGNDDLGTTSAWYVWSALGFYPETPGTADLALGSPVFPTAVVRAGNGATLTLSAPAAATDAPYVHRMTVDGHDWQGNFLPPHLLRHGGTVRYDLATTPDTRRGTAPPAAPPSYQGGGPAAIGYASATETSTTPGGTITQRVSARNLTDHPQLVRWSASAPAGVTLDRASGLLLVPPRGTASTPVRITGGADAGRYPVTLSFRAEGGRALPAAVLTVVVAVPGDLTPFFNEYGVSTDGQPNTAQIDSSGHSYSAQALAAAGLAPGATVTVDGLAYRWPSVPAGQPIGVLAAGQTVPVPATPGAARIGLLGATNSVTPGAQVTLTVTYTDGTTGQVTLGFSDWTLGAGKYPPAFGDTVAATMPYRNTASGAPEMVKTYLFTTSAGIDPSRVVASLTLPPALVTGKFHVFAIGIGT